MQKLFEDYIPAGVKKVGNIIISFNNDEVSNKISHCLQLNGFGVYTCKTFAELMEIEHEDVKCIVVDITKGHRSTFHAIELIKQLPLGAIIPLLVVADRESTTNVVRALNSGANDYIIHPYSDKDFIARIKKMISTRAEN